MSVTLLPILIPPPEPSEASVHHKSCHHGGRWVHYIECDLGEIQTWLMALSSVQRRVLAVLLRRSGTYTEDRIIDDYIDEHGGKRWYRYFLSS